MRWLRAAWRHGNAITAAAGALVVGGFCLARGYGLGPAIVGVGLSFVLAYGALRGVDALYRAGVLRGR